MANICTILCPVDVSEGSNRAFAQALEIARWYGARLTLLHVLPGSDRAQQIDQCRSEATSAVTALAAAARDVVPDVMIQRGHPSTAIIECAAATGADLIVMASRGTTGVRRLVLGSVTADVLRRAESAVLVVPPNDRAVSRLPFRHVLCAIDFSVASRTALAWARWFAREAPADLTLLHVLAAAPRNDLLATGPFAIPHCREQKERDVELALGSLIPEVGRASVAAVSRVTRGKSPVEIVRIADEQSADLIVIGAHGRHTLDSRILGSTTSQVIRRATCPVLAVRR